MKNKMPSARRTVLEMGARGFISCRADQEGPNVLGPSAMRDGSSSARSEDWIHDCIRDSTILNGQWQAASCNERRWQALEARSLDKAGIHKLFENGNLLDDADLKQQIGRFLVECVQLISEEGL